MTAELSEDACLQTHPGFTITCLACGSGRVVVHNALLIRVTWKDGAAQALGDVALACLACGVRGVVVAPEQVDTFYAGPD